MERNYPKHEDAHEVRVDTEFQLGVSSSASARQNHIGYKCVSEDGRQICQARINGFSFSRLFPYEKWSLLRDESQRLWNIYRDRVQPTEIIRIAVRYINRIDIPGDRAELSDYLRTFPEVSEDLPQDLTGFFMQLTIPHEDIGATLLINQTIVPPPQEGFISLVLDLDLFRDREVPQDEEGIWNYLEILHERKNHVFEACITDASRELFQ